MRLARFVFRHRFWAFAAVFFLGFSVAAVDHTPTAARLARWAAGTGPSPVTDRRADLALHAALWGGALLVVLAASLRTWAAAYLRSAVVHDPHVHAEALVADGPYRHVRNPLYLGGVLMALGFAVVAPLAGSVLMVAGVLGVVLALIAVEEAALAERMPERFAAYRARVPALVPALAPRLPPGDARPAWAQAFGGEAFFWSFAVGGVAMAATLDARWAGAAALAGVLVQQVVRPRVRANGAPVTSRGA